MRTIFVVCISFEEFHEMYKHLPGRRHSVPWKADHGMSPEIEGYYTEDIMYKPLLTDDLMEKFGSYSHTLVSHEIVVSAGASMILTDHHLRTISLLRWVYNDALERAQQNA